MIPRVEYASPGSVDEAVWMLSTAGARLLAGGQGLIPDLRTGADTATLLVDLRKVRGLRNLVRTEAGPVRVGALVTLADVAAAPLLKGPNAAFAEAAGAVGDHQVRNRATVGGALVHRSTGLDLPAAALALDAQVEVRLPDGQATMAADAALPAGSLLTAVDLPLADGASAYERHAHPAGHRAICGVAAWVAAGPGGALKGCRLAVTGVGPRPRRLEAAEKATQEGGAPAAIVAAIAGDIAGWEIPDDLAASGEYRAHLIGVLAVRALERARMAAGAPAHKA